MNFYEAETLEERIKIMHNLSQRFLNRASEIDETGIFPFANISDLKKSGYTSLTIPKEYGGKEISLYELVRLQEKLAEGDGSTALSIGWHMGIMKNLAEKRLWEQSLFKAVCEDVKKGALLNGAATEPQTGSPTRGGKPLTSARKAGQNWIINGRKTFTTMAPVLDYFIVSATIEESEKVGNFLIPRTATGIRIEETWNSIAMRGTASHDLVLENVQIPFEYFVEYIEPGNKKANGWLLHIPACYLGIAQAAQTYAINFAKEYSPNSIKGSIIELPNVQLKIGEMELELMKSRHFLYSVAKEWDSANKEERNKMQPVLGAVKMAVTNAAISIVDKSMRVVGARSLSLDNPLQRYYRDVRAGLHNPPMDDMTIQLLAKHAIRKNFDNNE
ncbi:acyl-CoA dehydrogenase family protein [Bacillus methanolicus]|uniref:Acyl-CoA dehydrogenase n=1 Tax=Bacillus methanolicus (strain MGA3 / ATCC 53907) TaxID=796606 RepID=I3E8K5_BACMM|nr:acyl-CoA dehydrogenase family protein [Bacillus methanolicus]AIE60098.1 Putative acyl-CoA dehydrogenase [Bacillus methanolicus MGA3]EIJ82826.1 putative acyl-CoA dehydrogenase, short-chain specific [Bacillus methanolicus MGA3]